MEVDANQSDLDILEDDNTPEPEPSETEEPEVEETEESDAAQENTDDEEEVKEEEEKEPDEDEEEESGLTDRVAHRELKAAYPDIFKKFPGLRPVIARENEFSKIYPSPEEAKESAQRLQGFENLGQTILSGNPETLLREIAASGEKNLEKFVQNFLPTINKNDPNLFVKTILPYTNNILREAQAAAHKTGNKNLFLAVQHLSQWLHNDPNVPDDRVKDPEIEKERERLEKEKTDFSKSRAESFRNESFKGAFDGIMRLIERGLDPEGVLGEKARKRAAQDVFDEIDEVVKADSRFMAGLKVAFKKAEQSGFSREASDSIRSAYLARVKPLLPAARQKVLQDYLPKNLRKPDGGKKVIPNSGSQGRNSSKLDAKKIDFSKTSDMDILNDRITFKK